MVMRVVLCEFLLCYWVEYGKLEKKLGVNLEDIIQCLIRYMCVLLITSPSPSAKILLLI